MTVRNVIALALLLSAEAFYLTIRFEAPPAAHGGRWWGTLLLSCHGIIQLAMLAVLATGTFGDLRFRVRFRRAIERDADERASWSTWLLAHGISLLAFTLLATFICDGGLATTGRPGAWVLALMVAGLATAVTWSAALLSPASWLTLARRGVRPIAMGAAVAGVAFWSSRYAWSFWDSMAGSTLAVARTMLRLVARDVTSDPAHLRLGVDGFVVRIEYACSGFEGIGLVVGFLAAYLTWFRSSFRWPRAYLLFPLGAALIWLLNAARIASLILIGAWGSPGIAMGRYHSQAGWIAFLAVSLGLVAASRRSTFFAARGRDVVEPIGSNTSASFLGPFLTILATSLITSAFSSGTDTLYWLRVLTGGLALWYFRRDFAGLLQGCSWAGAAIGVVAFGIWMALEPAPTGSASTLASTVWSWPRGEAWAWVALRVIGSVAIVPLAEELAFRGYLTRRLLSVDFESIPIDRFHWVSLAISSAAFGMLHGRWLAGMLVGILYALAMYRRGKLGDAVLAHAVTKLLIAVTVLATGDWTLWS